jgi:hypothetical protein
MIHVTRALSHIPARLAIFIPLMCTGCGSGSTPGGMTTAPTSPVASFIEGSYDLVAITYSAARDCQPAWDNPLYAPNARISMQLSGDGSGTWVGRAAGSNTVILRLRESSSRAAGSIVAVEGTLEGTIAPGMTESGTTRMGITFQSAVPISGTVLVSNHQALGEINGTIIFTEISQPSRTCTGATWLLVPPGLLPPG